MSLAPIGDSSPTPVPASTSVPTGAPPPAPSATPPLTEAQVLDELQKTQNPDDVYAKALQLIEQTQNDQVAAQAVQDAFDACIVAPAAKQIADAYSKGGAMAAAASLHNALKGAPPEVADSIFKAAKPTVDAIVQELGGTAFATRFLLPPTTSGSVTSLRKSQQDGVPQAYPPQLWRIASQDEFKSVYADLSAAVELASKGPDGDAVAKQVASSIVTALPYQAKDAVYFPSLENVDTNALMSSAVTNAVSSGDGAALSLALVKRASEVPAPSSTNGTSAAMAPPPRLETKQLFDAIATAIRTLRTNNDNAMTDFTTPAPELAQQALRWGGFVGDDAAGIAKLQDALAKTIDQTPSLAKPLAAKKEKVDQTAADAWGVLIDLQNAKADLQGVAGIDSLAGAATQLQQDQQTSKSLGVSATAQAAVSQAETLQLAKSNPAYNAPGKPPNLWWSSRVLRGLVSQIAAMKMPASSGDQLNAAVASISRMTDEQRKQLFGTSEIGAIKKTLVEPEGGTREATVVDAVKKMTDADIDQITARGGLALSTPAGQAMTGLSTALYLIGAADLIDTPVVPGKNPVPALINQSFGWVVLWGAVNNSAMLGSSWARTLLVGENSMLFKNKMPIGSWMDRLTSPAVGKGTIFEYSGEAFDGVASLLLAGIAAYEFGHKDYLMSGLHLAVSVIGGYPLAAKYSPKIPMWLAGGPQEAIAGDALEESVAAAAAVEAGGADLAGPLGTVATLLLTTGMYGVKKIRNEIAAASAEPLNRTMLHNLGFSTDQAKLLANDDEHGNSIGPTLQATAYRLGLSGKQMGDYLKSFTDMQKLNELVLATQNVNADAQGNYQATLLGHDDAIADAPAGLSGLALKGFYEKNTPLFDIPTLLPSADSQGQPPLNADDSYYRKLALERETPHSLDGLIQWAKDDGIPFPTAAPSGGGATTNPPEPPDQRGMGKTHTPAPAPTPTPTPTPTQRDVTARDGDTLGGIAQSNGTTLPGLAPLNPEFDWSLLGIDAARQGKRDPNLLFPGDIIHIPVGP